MSLVNTAYGSIESRIFTDFSYQVGRDWYCAVQITVKSAPLGFKLLQCRVRRKVTEEEVAWIVDQSTTTPAWVAEQPLLEARDL